MSFPPKIDMPQHRKKLDTKKSRLPTGNPLERDFSAMAYYTKKRSVSFKLRRTFF